MKWKLAAVLVSFAMLQACAGDGADRPITRGNGAAPSLTPNTAPPSQNIVATVAGEPITMQQLQEPLIESYGLNDLLLLVKLKLAHRAVGMQKLIVTPVDVETEKQLTLTRLRNQARRVTEMTTPSTRPEDDEVKPEEAEKLLEQIRSREHLSIPEFNIIMETNACLRKLAAPAVALNLTEDKVHAQFNALYGEKLVIRYIVTATPAEMNDVLRDLHAGKSFEDEAKARSIDTSTAANGGELYPFTRQDNSVPDIIREQAFSLKMGEISPMLTIRNYVYILKAVRKIPPEFAKYEDYKDVVRRDLVDQLVQAAMAKQQNELGVMALKELVVKDPVMAKQYQERLDQRAGEILGAEKIKKAMDDKRNADTTRPAEPRVNPFEHPAASQPTAPATMPAGR